MLILIKVNIIKLKMITLVDSLDDYMVLTLKNGYIKKLDYQ
jgi:hypothetical protein